MVTKTISTFDIMTVDNIIYIQHMKSYGTHYITDDGETRRNTP